jgi:hypothetical protein
MIIKVWHKVKHDDYGVSEVDTNMSIRKFSSALAEDGGLWHNNSFIPWHSISYIETDEN